MRAPLASARLTGMISMETTNNCGVYSRRDPDPAGLGRI